MCPMTHRDSGSPSAAEPAPSATVVVAREGSPAVEFLLVKRHARAAFGASHVFPGGLVEAQDRRVDARSRGLSAAEADRCLGVDEGGLAYYSAAIRELFEETGVLLACDAGGAVPRADEPFPIERRALLTGALSWPRFLDRHGLGLAADRLSYIAWWITPVARPARFSTRFFLARMPKGQAARHDGRELTDSFWITAEGALAAAERGELRLPPPTLATLRVLAARWGISDLETWAAGCAAAGVPCVLPVIEARDGRERILLPGDPDYPCDGGDGGSGR